MEPEFLIENLEKIKKFLCSSTRDGTSVDDKMRIIDCLCSFLINISIDHNLDRATMVFRLLKLWDIIDENIKIQIKEKLKEL